MDYIDIDDKWLVPHFEKMLYDQALMVVVYIEAYQVTKEEVYRETAQEILEYVKRDMLDKNGAFYCAEDADSEGEEGKFYLWTEEEIDSILVEKSDYMKNYYGIRKDGNYLDESTREKTGNNILYLDNEEKLVMIDKKNINEFRELLFREREKRVRPSLDDKILTDWNGLMISAFAMAGRVFENQEYIDIAKKACSFILHSIKENNGLMHRYGKGKWDIKGHLDDYVFLITSLIELYEVTFDENYIKEATQLTRKCIELFWDHDRAGFYFTSIEGEQLLVRKKEIYDGAIPSGNSVMLLNLLKLSGLTDNEDLSQKASEMLSYFVDEVKEYPSGYTQMLCGYYYAFGNSGEITIEGDLNDTATKEMIKSVYQEYLPNIILKLRKSSDKPKATLCLNRTCSDPASSINELLQRLV
ncbi:hypothetical protein [Alkalibaculum sporogenes]|uniref:thioredoxin domain-containing protein n=1 Tax=Alkalibaculum sporogenes TaxID=2655001 RepID=UPI0031B5DD10